MSGRSIVVDQGYCFLAGSFSDGEIYYSQELIMQTNLDIQLSENAFSALSVEAAALGKSPGELAANVVESVFSCSQVGITDSAARVQFEQCFGSVDLGQPIGIANEAIDVDLARSYQQ
jgi:hypothetical protein